MGKKTHTEYGKAPFIPSLSLKSLLIFCEAVLPFRGEFWSSSFKFLVESQV